MNRKRWQNATQKGIFRSAKDALLEGKMRPTFNPLAANGLNVGHDEAYNLSLTPLPGKCIPATMRLFCRAYSTYFFLVSAACRGFMS